MSYAHVSYFIRVYFHHLQHLTHLTNINNQLVVRPLPHTQMQQPLTKPQKQHLHCPAARYRLRLIIVDARLRSRKLERPPRGAPVDAREGCEAGARPDGHHVLPNHLSINCVYTFPISSPLHPHNQPLQFIQLPDLLLLVFRLVELAEREFLQGVAANVPEQLYHLDVALVNRQVLQVVGEQRFVYHEIVEAALLLVKGEALVLFPGLFVGCHFSKKQFNI